MIKITTKSLSLYLHFYTFSQLPMSLILQGIPMQISAYRLHLLHEICLTCQRAVQKHLSSALSEISERFEPHKGNTRLHTPQPINSEPITQKQAHNNNNEKKRSNTRSQQSCGLHFPFSIYFFHLFSLSVSPSLSLSLPLQFHFAQFHLHSNALF